MEPEDSILWARSRAGDADAFGLLFERHAKAIYNYCFRRTGDWALAEDLLSVVFLEAWRRRRKELEPGKVLPWLYGIATNVVRNQRRSQRRFAGALRRFRDRNPSWDSRISPTRGPTTSDACARYSQSSRSYRAASRTSSRSVRGSG